MKYSDWKAKSEQYALKEDLSGKTVAFTFGRFQPPTSGHQKLVDALASAASKAGAQAFLYPSRTNDAKKNPLTPSVKIKWLRKFFGDSVKIVDDSSAKTMFDVLNKFDSAGVKKVIMVVGGDRVEEMKNAIKPYLTHKDPSKRYKFEFEVVSAGERDPDAEGVVGMSASKMRAAAAEDNLKAFMGGIPDGVSKLDAASLFKELRRAMGANMKESLEEVAAFSPDNLVEVGEVAYASGASTKFWLDEQDGIFFAVETDSQGNSIEGGYGTIETMLRMYPMAWSTLKPYLREFATKQYISTNSRRRIRATDDTETGTTEAVNNSLLYPPGNKSRIEYKGWRLPGKIDPLEIPGEQYFLPYQRRVFTGATSGQWVAFEPSTPVVVTAESTLLKPWMLQLQSLKEIVATGVVPSIKYIASVPCSKRELPMRLLRSKKYVDPMVRNLTFGKNEAEEAIADSHMLKFNKAYLEFANLFITAANTGKESDWKEAQQNLCKNYSIIQSGLPTEISALLLSGPAP